jgi:L-fuculose-phosphate aldolase
MPVSIHLKAFQRIGRRLNEAGLIHGSSGNLSLRLNGQLLITTHGSNLADLKASDVVETGIFSDDANTPLASSELQVHRAIYKETDARAVVHAHPAGAVTLSVRDKAAVIGKTPILGESTEIIPGALSAEIARALKTCSLVMVRGHGSFAVGKTMEQALKLTLAFEDGCQGLCEERGLKPNVSSEA